MSIETIIILAVAIVVIGVCVLVLLRLRLAGAQSDQLRAAELAVLERSLQQQIADRDRQISEAKADLAEERARFAALQTDYSTLQSQFAALHASAREQARQADENLKRFQTARQQMTDEFKAIAGEVLKSHGETFSKQNKDQVELLLKPLGERIEEFKKGIATDRAELVEQVRALHATSLNVAQEATNLTRALKGNTQTQGAWGEMILTSILERSGLQKGVQYRYQETHANDEQRNVRTDVEVIFPNGDVIVIDSKVSLTAFEAFVNAPDDETRTASMRDHVASLRGHIRILASKEYQRHANSAFDFVLMFVPIEGAFAAALTAEPRILDEALGQNVFIATPTTLMSALRTIRNVWQIENRQRNAEEIAERAGRLYDKVAGFLQNMDKVDGALKSTRNAFDLARKQLSEGNGSVVRQIEMLKGLGAKTGKSLPPGWDGGEEGANDSRLADERAAFLIEGNAGRG